MSVKRSKSREESLVGKKEFKFLKKGTNASRPFESTHKHSSIIL